MLAYFAAPRSGLDKYKNSYQLILKTVKQLGFEIADNWIISKLNNKDLYKDADEMVQTEGHLLNQADFVIAEISVPSFGIGYIIKQALVQRKPVLCLYPDNLDKEAASEVFLGNASNLLKIEYYNKSNIKEIIDRSLNATSLNGLQKFNFLISSEISQYLDWAVEKNKQSRSEYLRDTIKKEIILKNKIYQEYLKQSTNKKKK